VEVEEQKPFSICHFPFLICHRQILECADLSALWPVATCRDYFTLVFQKGMRRQAAALQIQSMTNEK